MASRGSNKPTAKEKDENKTKNFNTQTETMVMALANVGVVTGARNPAAGLAIVGDSLLSIIYKALPIYKNIALVEPVSDTWKNRPKANIVKWLMKQSGVGLEEVAAHLGCSVSYLNNKLSRESFSFEDLILAAYASTSFINWRKAYLAGLKINLVPEKADN